jgi:hypothetical protein
MTTPWRALCVDLIGPYTRKGKDGSSIDFMCLTVIDPTMSWFEIVELPTVNLVTTVSPAGKGKKVICGKTLRWEKLLLIRVQRKSVTQCIKAGLVDIPIVDT